MDIYLSGSVLLNLGNSNLLFAHVSRLCIKLNRRKTAFYSKGAKLSPNFAVITLHFSITFLECYALLQF